MKRLGILINKLKQANQYVSALKQFLKFFNLLKYSRQNDLNWNKLNKYVLIEVDFVFFSGGTSTIKTPGWTACFTICFTSAGLTCQFTVYSCFTEPILNRAWSGSTESWTQLHFKGVDEMITDATRVGANPSENFNFKLDKNDSKKFQVFFIVLLIYKLLRRAPERNFSD